MLTWCVACDVGFDGQSVGPVTCVSVEQGGKCSVSPPDGPRTCSGGDANAGDVEVRRCHPRQGKSEAPELPVEFLRRGGERGEAAAWPVIGAALQ